MPKNLADLPDSKDDEFWGEAERHVHKPIRLGICEIHTKKHWQEGTYRQNRDGSISCTECGWGTKIPGYMRLDKEGKVVDLRILSSQTEKV